MIKRIVGLLFLLFLLSVKSAAQNDTVPVPLSPDEQLAAQYYQSGEYDKAVVYYEKLYNKNPIDVYYHYYLNCLLYTKNFRKAEKTVKKQTNRNTNNLTYKVDLGRVYKAEGETDKAKKEFDGAVNAITGITSTMMIIDLSDAFMDINETEYAVETLKKGRKELKGVYGFHIELADVYYMRKDYALMVGEYLDLLEISDAFKQQVQNLLQARMDADTENKISPAVKAELIKRSQKSPDNTIWSEMLMWYYMQQNNFQQALIQAKAVDRRKKYEGEQVMDLAETARLNRQYGVAIDAYDYVIGLGEESMNYRRARMEKVNTQYEEVVSTPDYTMAQLLETDNNMKTTLDELGRDARTIPLIRMQAHLKAFYLKQTKEAIKILEEALAMPGVNAERQAECKLELGDVLLLDGQVWEASLRYSQVEKAFKAEPIGQEAKYRNAKIAFYIGDFEWAQLQLDVLKGATSKLISNDAIYLSILITENLALDSNPEPLMKFAKADLMLFQNRYDDALLYLDSLERDYPTHSLADDIMYMRYRIAMKQQKYQEAAVWLDKLIQMYPTDVLGDDATFRMAELYDFHLNDKEKAKKYYSDLIVNYPGSLFAVDARKRYRQLRGDKETD